MRVCGYCRVSTNSDDQANSFENQQSYFIREIAAKGHEMTRIYADKGLTGTKLNNRPEFEQMLTDAGIDVKTLRTAPNDVRVKTKHTVYELSDREPEFDEIWVKNTSRFARNTLSSEIIDLLRQKKVNVFFIEQGINTSDLSQGMLLKLLQVFDEQDSRDKSSKVRFGHQEGAKKGVIHTSGKLYGYRYNKDDNSLSIVENEAEIVRRIFDMYERGMGIRRIIGTLTLEGIATRKGKRFGKTTISRILRNEKYAGLNNPLKYDTGIVFQKNASPKVREQYEVKPSDRIEPIITPEQFERCRVRMQNAVGHMTQRGKYSGTSEYAGLLVCGVCGAKYHSNRDKGRPFYNCSGKRLYGKSYCSNANVSLVDVDNVINTLLNGGYDELFHKQVMETTILLLAKIIKLSKQIDSDRESAGREIEKRIEEDRRVLGRYYDLFAREQSDAEILSIKINELQEQIRQGELEYEEATKTNKDIQAEIAKCYLVIDELRSRKGTFAPKDKATALSLIKRIVVNPNENGKEATLDIEFVGGSDVEQLVDAGGVDLSSLTQVDLDKAVEAITQM